MAWTEQQITDLRLLWSQGKSASEIAKKLGNMTRNAVIGKAHRLGLNARPSPIKAGGAASVTPLRAAPKTATPAAARPAAPQRATAEAQPKKTMASGTIMALVNRSTRPSGGASVHNLPERHQCKWPVGDPRDSSFHFCSAEVHAGFPYCLDHARIAYQGSLKKHELRDVSGQKADNS
jgi:GcrA cell cycle regulator